jgi:hypothetical protein
LYKFAAGIRTRRCLTTVLLSIVVSSYALAGVVELGVRKIVNVNQAGELEKTISTLIAKEASTRTVQDRSILLYGSMLLWQGSKVKATAKVNYSKLDYIRTHIALKEKDPELLVLSGWWLFAVGSAEFMDDSPPDRVDVQYGMIGGKMQKVETQHYDRSPIDERTGMKMIEKGLAIDPDGLFSILFKTRRKVATSLDFEKASNSISRFKGAESMLLMKSLKSKNSPEYLRKRYQEAWNKLPKDLLFVRITNAER